MPPDNGSYLVAAYIVAGLVYAGYTLWLARRGRQAGRRLGG